MALLSLQQIHKTFEKGTVNENHVLRGLDLDIEQGDFISVIGGNGAGKSTLMNSIAGVLSIDEGDILLDGQSIKKASVDERSKDISLSLIHIYTLHFVTSFTVKVTQLKS